MALTNPEKNRALKMMLLLLRAENVNGFMPLGMSPCDGLTTAELIGLTFWFTGIKLEPRQVRSLLRGPIPPNPDCPVLPQLTEGFRVAEFDHFGRSLWALAHVEKATA